MEGIIQVIAVLVIMFFLGAQNVSKKMREQKKDSLDDLTPVFPPPPKVSSTENRSEERQNPYTREPSKPQRPESEPFPAPASKEPVWSKMLREMLELDEPKPAPIQEIPPQPVRSEKKLIRKSKDSAQKIAEKKRTAPPTLPPVTARRKQVQTSPLAAIYKRSETEPLKAAILLSEIIQAPRAKRKNIRTL